MHTQFIKDNLKVFVFNDRQTLGKEAAMMVSDKTKELLNKKNYVNIIFAAAPSQNEFLHALIKDSEMDWGRINAFHMDEYLGLQEDSPQLFGNFLKERLFALVPFRSVNYIHANAVDIQKECKRYADLLSSYSPDIVCMGIGENTHIAFNDPHKADFNDAETIKRVTLDAVCRQQQVNDGCFNTLNEVPEHALTLTIPALMKASFIYCMVPGITKAIAITHTLNEPVTEEFPSTILRKHHAATLFLDPDSYSNFKSHFV